MVLMDSELEAFFQDNLQTLINLRVEIYKGVHFHPEAVMPGAVDSVLEISSAPLEAVERLVNHIHIRDWFYGLQDMERLERLADEVAKAWADALKVLDPQYRVFRFTDDNGPGLTFYLDRQSSQ